MNVLGLHLGHDSTIALIVDNRLVASVQKERLTRKKHDRGFLPEMLDKCLNKVHRKQKKKQRRVA